MFDAPIDTWYVWIGVAVASLAVAGVAADLPTQPPPDTVGVANTIDRVAASPYPASAVHPVTADAVKFEGRTIALRNDEGVARARVATESPVVPVGRGKPDRVLNGYPVEYLYNTTGEFEDDLDRARAASGEWRPVDGRIVVRKVTWGTVDVTLVGT